MKQIQAFLMFKKGAENAAEFYVNIFPNSKILNKTRWGEQEIKWMEGRFSKEQIPGPVGSVKVVTFELNGQRFEACNGGSPFDFSMGVSLYTNCDTQEEIDTQTEALLSDGGEQLDCGWVKDKFGVYWQVAPAILADMLRSPDQHKAERVAMALYKMKKIDIAMLKQALDGSLKEESTPAMQ